MKCNQTRATIPFTKGLSCFYVESFFEDIYIHIYISLLERDIIMSNKEADIKEQIRKCSNCKQQVKGHDGPTGNKCTATNFLPSEYTMLEGAVGGNPEFSDDHVHAPEDIGPTPNKDVLTPMLTQLTQQMFMLNNTLQSVVAQPFLML